MIKADAARNNFPKLGCGQPK